MTLGKKIKALRESEKLTQSALSGDKITRNMLSLIESDSATPSLDTLDYIAKKLGVTVSYLLSEDDSPFYYKKKEKIKEIREIYQKKDYGRCIDLTMSLGDIDDELALILCNCHFEIARRAALNGSLVTAKKHLTEAMNYSNSTIYDTERISILSLLYSAIINNIQSPLLEFDSKCFEERLDEYLDFDFYKYLVQDSSYKYLSPLAKKHYLAKEYIKERRYEDALSLLKEIEEAKTPENYNAYLIFGVYSDIENCYKQLADFENAYRYSTKRISLIEGFNI